MGRIAFLSFCFLITHSAFAELKNTPAQHGIDLYGQMKYAKDFAHFDYVNPNAPKGGKLRIASIGTFDSLNPFVIKGTPAAGMAPIHATYSFATLMKHAHDEPISSYGYIAESVKIDDEGKSVVFKIRSNATFHDGSPITAQDFVFTFNILKEKGHPFYRSYYREIIKAEALSPLEIKFHFESDDNKELPVIIGEMPVLSEAFYKTHDFDEAGLTPPLGSGPYKVSGVNAGVSITYERVKNWWGENLPVNVGQNNFDVIDIQYYRDSTVALEAFKAGDIDIRLEKTAKNWAKGYASDALDDGRIIKHQIPHEEAQGMTGFMFNIRRDLFKDIRVRKALSLAYNFEWTNKNLFFGLYKRSNSYFSNSELASRGVPQGNELALLEPFRDQLPAEIFEKEFKMPVNSGRKDLRQRLREAKVLLKEAGWDIKNGVLTHTQSGQKLEFELLFVQPDLVRVANDFIQNLKMLGVKVNVRIVDTAQYLARMDEFDFDMIFGGFGQSNSPGNEQIEFWGSQRANAKGGRNYIGIQNPVLDALIEKLIDAPTREALVDATRALDRVLLWNFYMVPGYYNDKHFVATSNRLGRPESVPKYHLGINTWWIKPKAKI